MPLKIKNELSEIEYSLTEVVPNINDEQIIKSEILSFLFIYQVNLRIKPFLPLD